MSPAAKALRNLDVSVIDELPPGRQTVETYAVTGAYHQRVYKFIDKQIAAGRQAYIVCSMVEENDTIPDEPGCGCPRRQRRS